MAKLGIPYANANDDGSVTCPKCGERIGPGMDESQRTTEDAITKGSSRLYAEHYAAKHERRLECKRFGFGPYDGASADGWHVMDGDESVAGPFCDAGVARRHLREIESRSA